MFWEETYIGITTPTEDGNLIIPYHYKRTYPKWMFWKAPRHKGFEDIAFVPVIANKARLDQVVTKKFKEDIPDDVLCFLVTMCCHSNLQVQL